MNYEERHFIERLANAIIQAFKIDIPIRDIDYVVLKLGGEIETSTALTQFSEGKIEVNGSGGFKITIPEQQPAKRRLFTIAHELGHLFLHMGYIIDSKLWESKRDEVYHRHGNSKEEYEAHTFAAALLMPEAKYEVIIKANTDEHQRVDIEKVAEHFGVSSNAAINRGKWLGYFKW